MNVQVPVGRALSGMAHLALERDAPIRAARLLGASDLDSSHPFNKGFFLHAHDRLAETNRRITEALGEARTGAELSIGLTMDARTAIGYALGDANAGPFAAALLISDSAVNTPELDAAIAQLEPLALDAPLADCLSRRGIARLSGHDPTGAEEDLHRALEVQVRLGDTCGVSRTIEAFAELMCMRGMWTDASRLVGAAIRLGSRTVASDLAQNAESEVGGEYQRLLAEGAGMSPGSALAYVTKRRGARKRPASGWESLTPIEGQVVELVVQGLTNPQIGERLFISRRTVQAHLARIFPKLGVTSRAQLAAESARIASKASQQ